MALKYFEVEAKNRYETHYNDYNKNISLDYSHPPYKFDNHNIYYENYKHQANTSFF
ncbi:hypothetical protein C1646_695349 [Rhizophagus diaphanus]|nr:hypothetical protein C1646_695349 [Rhizophagus diaphanus] [Rhizophagus sp. MUCL 43196]